MIDNPEFKKRIWNPLVHYQLGESNTGIPVAIFTSHGEEGTEVSLMYPDIDYLRGVAKLYVDAITDMERVIDGEDIDTVLAELDGRSNSKSPDDISSLEEGS